MANQIYLRILLIKKNCEYIKAFFFYHLSDIIRTIFIESFQQIIFFISQRYWKSEKRPFQCYSQTLVFYCCHAFFYLYLYNKKKNSRILLKWLRFSFYVCMAFVCTWYLYIFFTDLTSYFIELLKYFITSFAIKSWQQITNNDILGSNKGTDNCIFAYVKQL